MKQGEVSMFIIDKNIVTVGRRWRSKWWHVTCTCGASKRRKDGTCKHERGVFEILVPKIKRYARIVGKEM